MSELRECRKAYEAWLVRKPDNAYEWDAWQAAWNTRATDAPVEPKKRAGELALEAAKAKMPHLEGAGKRWAEKNELVEGEASEQGCPYAHEGVCLAPTCICAERKIRENREGEVSEAVGFDEFDDWARAERDEGSTFDEDSARMGWIARGEAGAQQPSEAVGYSPLRRR